MWVCAQRCGGVRGRVRDDRGAVGLRADGGIPHIASNRIALGVEMLAALSLVVRPLSWWVLVEDGGKGNAPPDRLNHST